MYLYVYVFSNYSKLFDRLTYASNRPHCDGTCDGSLHHPAGRVATAVLYCKTPERGGATTFTKADVFINPKPGMATFFSYKDVNSGHMDDGFTEHSGCPVIDGEKWISTVVHIICFFYIIIDLFLRHIYYYRLL